MTDERDIRASQDEMARAEALRRALEGETAEDDEAEAAELFDLAERVRAASGLAPPLEPDARNRAVEAALGAMPAPETTSERATRKGWPRWAAMALAAGLAAVVAGALLVQRPWRSGPQLPDEAYAAPTDALFEGPFPEDQRASERADRIVAARTRGYFARMAAEQGVKASAEGDAPSAQASVALLDRGVEP